MNNDDIRALSIFVKYAEYHQSWYYNAEQWGREEVVFCLDRDGFWGRTQEQLDDLKFLSEYLKKRPKPQIAEKHNITRRKPK